MGYLRFDTEAEANTYDHALLMEVAEFKGLPVVDGKVLGYNDGQVTAEYPTTAWSPIRQVEGLGWLIYPPDWRVLNDYEKSIFVEWIEPQSNGINP